MRERRDDAIFAQDVVGGWQVGWSRRPAQHELARRYGVSGARDKESQVRMTLVDALGHELTIVARQVYCQVSL